MQASLACSSQLIPNIVECVGVQYCPVLKQNERGTCRTLT